MTGTGLGANLTENVERADVADEQELTAVSQLCDNNHQKTGPVVVNGQRLRSAQRRLSLAEYLAAIVSYQPFTLLYARYRVNVDNDDMFLGRLWTVLEPLLRIAMYGAIFGLFLRTSRGIDNFVGFLVIGVMFFSMMSKGLSAGSGLLKRSKALMRTFNFPRATLVIAEGYRTFLGSIIPAILAVVAAIAFQNGKGVAWALLAIVPLLVLIHVFALGLMFVVARVTAFVPDTRKIVSFVNRGWFYASGVFFSVERYATVPEVQSVMEANPAYRFLEAIRGVVLQGVVPPLAEWAVLMAWSFGTLLVGFFFFWAAEDRYVRMR